MQKINKHYHPSRKFFIIIIVLSLFFIILDNSRSKVQRKENLNKIALLIYEDRDLTQKELRAEYKEISNRIMIKSDLEDNASLLLYLFLLLAAFLYCERKELFLYNQSDIINVKMSRKKRELQEEYEIEGEENE